MKTMGFRVLFLAIAALFCVSAAPLSSISNITSLQTGDAVRIVSDAAGNSYVGLNNVNPAPSLVALAPDGSIRFRKDMTGLVDHTITDMAAFPGGGAVVTTNLEVARFDSNGNLVFSAPLLAQHGAVACDAAGDIFTAAETIGSSSSGAAVFGIVISRLDSTGKALGSFRVTAPGTPGRMTVDSAGAVYLAGQIVTVANTPFPTTPGAFMETNPKGSGSDHGFVMKIAPALDRVVYSTLLGGQSDYATAIAVDNTGAAYVGGMVVTGPGYSSSLTTVLNPIGFPIIRIPGSKDVGTQIGYVVKLSPSGSSLLYAAAPCSNCHVESLTPAPDGRVQAIADTSTYFSAGELFTINTAGTAVDSVQTFGGLTGAVDLAAGPAGSIRVLGQVPSPEFPVVYNEGGTPWPAVFEIPPAAKTSDITVSAKFLAPSNSPGGKFQLTVSNNGAADAEYIEVHFPFPVVLGETNCTPTAEAVAWVTPGYDLPGWTVIPRLAAGAQLDLICTGGVLANSVQPYTQPVQVFSLSPDSNATNNYIEVTDSVGYAPGFSIIAPSINNIDFTLYRSDIGGTCGIQVCSFTAVTGSQITVGFPEPQRWNGNFWYFDSWSDGDVTNPRTFDISSDGSSSGKFTVRAAQPIGADPSSIDFVAVSGLPPAQVTISLYPSTQTPNTWSAGPPSASWIKATSITPGVDSFRKTPYASLTAQADISGLAPGQYTASIPVSMRDVTGATSTTDVPVSLRILDKTPVISGAVDAASYRQSISTGQITTVFGSGFGPLITNLIPAAGEGVYTAGGVSVQVGGSRAALIAVSDTQVSAIVTDVVPLQQDANPHPVDVTVNLGGSLVLRTQTNSAILAPGLFTLDSSGRGNVAAINQDGSVNSTQQPAHPGSIVAFYGTGFTGNITDGSFGGCTSGLFTAGSLGGMPLGYDATIGGKAAEVLYSGNVPGLVCGLQQVNVRIPLDSPVGDAVPLLLRTSTLTGSYTTQDGLTISVQ